jgi:hypothetical protein
VGNIEHRYVLTHDQLEMIKEKLAECMPLDTMVTDLWDRDIRCEEVPGARLCSVQFGLPRGAEQIGVGLMWPTRDYPSRTHRTFTSRETEWEMEATGTGRNDVLGWEEISSIAETIFGVWTCGGDLEWGRQAWKALETAGLTSCADDIGSLPDRVGSWI